MFKFLNKQTASISAAGVILAGAALASRFLGLLRDRLLASHFGAGDTLDVYYAAFQIPDLIFNLLVVGALSAGFIPIFVGLWQKDDVKETWRFVNSILNLVLLGLLVLTAIFFIFMPFFMKMLVPGFGAEKFDQAVTLTRLMFLSPILLGASTVFGGVLQGVKRFLVVALTPIFYNLGIIFGILFLAPRWGVFGLALGVILGALLHLVIQIPAVRHLGFRYQFIFDRESQGVQRLARLMLPRILTLALSQLNFLAMVFLASGLAAGSLAIFNLSYNLWNFPLGILAASFAMAAFPSLAEKAATKNWEEFSRTFSSAFRQILFLILPAAFLFWVLAEPVVRVILGAGKFGLADILISSTALKYLCLGLFAEALNLLLARSFFALENTQTPFFLGILSSILRIGGAWFFAFFLGVPGLALGFALGGIVYFVLLWIFLAGRIEAPSRKEILLSSIKIITASILAGVVAWISLQGLALVLNTQEVWGVFIQGLMAGLLGIAVYSLTAYLLKLSEMVTLWQIFKKRWPFGISVSGKEIE